MKYEYREISAWSSLSLAEMLTAAGSRGFRCIKIIYTPTTSDVPSSTATYVAIMERRLYETE